MSYSDVQYMALRIKKKYPNAMITVDWSKSKCFLDVIANNKFYVFEERPLVNWYAASRGMEKTYGEEPDHTFTDRLEAESCFFNLIEEDANAKRNTEVTCLDGVKGS